jgi:hypothetical protein
MNESSGRLPPAEVRRDAKRDVLALVQAVIDDDDATFGARRRDGGDRGLLLPAALVLLADSLREQGTDVAEWIARKRQLLLEAEARGVDEVLPEP